ncbi:MAG: ABC transporter permease [Gemmatimonadota bacterium]
MALGSGFKRLFRIGDPMREIDEELEFHLAMKTEELVASGMTPEAARAKAMERLGDADWIREECGTIRRELDRQREQREWFDTLRRDVRYALRRMARQPVFASLAVLVLALGVGANTTIFRDDPAVEAQDELVGIYRQRLSTDRLRDPRRDFGHLGYLQYKEQARSFAGMTAWRPLGIIMNEADGSVSLSAKLVSSDYFDVLGVDMYLGRSFLPEEGRTPGTHPVAVVSYALWRDRLGANPDLRDLTIRLNQNEFQVVGVAPRGFTGLDVWDERDIWVPLAMESAVNARFPVWGDNFFDDILHVVARLAPGVDVAQAQAELDVLAAQIEEVNEEAGVRRRVVVDSWVRAQSSANFYASNALTPFTALSVLFLVLACVNISGLVLVRTLERRREIGFRLALGAGRGRIVRQLLTESAILAIPAAILGLAVARGLAEGLAVVAGPQLDLSLDHRVMAFAVLTAVVATVLLGLAPALQATRFARWVGESDTPTRSERRPRLLSALVVGQLSATLILLIGAGSFVRTLQRAGSVELGFASENLLLLEPDLRRVEYSAADAQSFYDQLETRIAHLPGVTAVTTAGNVPRFDNGIARWCQRDLWREGSDELPPMTVEYNTVGPGYFETMGIPVVAGRGFSRPDGEGGAPVAVVNETLAETLGGPTPPLGQQVRLAGSCFSDTLTVQVIGVVADVRTFMLDDAPPPEVFLPIEQTPSANRVVIARNVPGAAGLSNTIRREVGAIDPLLLTPEVESMEERIEQGLSTQRTMADLSTVVGILSLLLATIGLFASLAFAVSRRTKEFGIRVALGARKLEVLRLVLGEGMTLTGIGVVVGLGASYWLLRVVNASVFTDVGTEFTRPDPWVIGACVLVLFTAALAACWRPARRATTTHPMETLRYE